MNNNYYQFEVRKQTFGELRQLCPNFYELIACGLVKTLRIPLRIPSGYRYPNDFILVAERSVPGHIAERFGSELFEVKQLELQNEFVYKLATLGNLEVYGWSGLVTGKPVIVNYVVTRYDEPNYIDEKNELQLISLLDDKRVLLTSDRKNILNFPANFEYSFDKQANIETLLQQHLERVASSGSRPTKISSLSHEQILLEIQREHFDNLVERKSFRPATAKTVAKWRE